MNDPHCAIGPDLVAGTVQLGRIFLRISGQGRERDETEHWEGMQIKVEKEA